MIKKIKELAKKQERIIANFSYLTLFQVFALAIPLLIYPYVIKIVGVSNWGRVAFAQTLNIFFLLLTQFGLTLSATRQISLHRDDKEEIEKIFTAVYCIKAFFNLIGILILLAMVFLIPSLYEDRLMYILAFSLCVGDMLFPIWYFQGIEKMGYITVIRFIAKFIFLILIFLFIKEQQDYAYIPFLDGLGMIIAGALAMLFTYKKHFIRFRKVSLNYIMGFVKDSCFFFAADFIVALTTRLNLLLIKVFIGYDETAYYDLCYKLISLAKVPFMTLNQVLFPALSKSFNRNTFYKIVSGFAVASVSIYVGLLIFGKWAIWLLGREEMLPAKSLLNLLGIELPLSCVSALLGIVLASQNLNKNYMKADLYSFFIYAMPLLVIYLITGTLTITAMIICLLIAVLFTLIYKYNRILKNNLLAH